MKLQELVSLNESEAKVNALVSKYGSKLMDMLAKNNRARHEFGDMVGYKDRPLDAKSVILVFKEDLEDSHYDPSRKHLVPYLDWIIRELIKDPKVLEDFAEAIVPDLLAFDRLKNHLPTNERDINKYSRRELQRKVESMSELDMKSQREIKKDELAKLKKDIITVYEGPKGRVYIPKTEEASCFLGRGTRWCTAATKSRNYFHDYNKNGPLYVLVLPNGDKYQYQCPDYTFFDSTFEFIQLMDPSDYEVHNPQAVHGLVELMIAVAQHDKEAAYRFFPYFAPYAMDGGDYRISMADLAKIYKKMDSKYQNTAKISVDTAPSEDEMRDNPKMDLMQIAAILRVRELLADHI